MNFRFHILLVFNFALIIFNTLKTLNQNFNKYTNSDLLYPALFTEELTGNFRNSFGWDLTPSVYFFPDLFLFFLFRIFTNEIGILFLIYSICFSILIFFYFYQTSKDLITSSSILNLILTCFSYFPENLGLFFFPTYHVSAFLFTLYFQKNYKSKLIWLIFPILLFSDKILFTVLIIPFFFLYRTELNLKLIFLFLVGIFISSFIEFILKKNQIFHFVEIPILSTLKFIIKNFSAEEYLNYLKFIFSQESILKENLVFVFGILLVLIFLFKKKELKPVTKFVLVSILVNILFQFFFKIYNGYRYNWFLYLIPFISLFEYYHENLKKYFYFVILICLFVLISDKSIFSKKNFILYPEFVSCIDKLSENYNLKNGIADYWNAKYIRAFSKSKISVIQKQNNLDSYNWISNRNWEIQTSYDFIIQQRLDENKIIEKFSTPNKIENCNSIPIWIYEKAKFVEEEKTK